jgi:Leucine-rich repeat (LRR) protein
MEKLTKLQLDNNIITKIQGLECLVNLEWLDLSFNMITKIEGLDNCLKLTDLSLFKNRITVLSGLENLKELNVLSVGSNALANLEDSIDYLRKLKNKLEVLRISDNAFQKQRNTEYKKYTMARLKNLKYIDYELIEKKERE